MQATRGFMAMTRPLWRGGVLVAAFLAGGGAASVECADDTPVGSEVFKTYCASCHGVEGTGDGPLSGQLRTLPPDLTKLAAHHRGRFDAEAVGRIIDGRNPIPGHGGPDMPVWGDAFKQSRDGYSEASVKARIAALVEFLESIQAR